MKPLVTKSKTQRSIKEIFKAFAPFRVNKIYREIFASLPAIDGRLSELSQQERDTYVKQLYRNTKEVLKYGSIVIPIKKSHDDANEELKGRLVGVELHYHENPTPHVTVVGEILLDDQMYKSYQEGRYPGASIEIGENADLTAYTGKRTKVNQYISAVAMLGSSPAAMPNLRMLDETGKEQPNPYMLYTRLPNKFSCNEEYGMNIKEKLLGKIMEFLDELFPPNDSEEQSEELIEKPLPEDGFEELPESKPEMEEPANYEKAIQDRDSRIKELEEKVAAMEQRTIENEYQLLVSNGKITPEQKTYFMKIASAHGLEFARGVYGDVKLGPPMEQNVVKKQPEKMTIANDEEQRLKDSYRAMGITDPKRIDALWDAHVKKNQMKVSKGV